MLRALIVDDEAPARLDLRYLLEKEGEVKVVGEAASADEAMELIQGIHYDVLFLDIQMPGMNGLEVVRKCEGMRSPPLIVFVTAYEEYAVQAFDFGVADYLLKPISEERLRRTLARNERQLCLRAKRQKNEDTFGGAGIPPTRATTLDLLAAELNGRILLLNLGDIIYAYAKDGKVLLRTREATCSCRLSMRDLDSKLISKGFLRCHRSFLVNMRHVKEVEPSFSGTYLLHIDGLREAQIPVSRSQSKQLRDILGFA